MGTPLRRADRVDLRCALFCDRPADFTVMAPLCVKRGRFRLCECAPVLAAVKQSALDCGCGPEWAGGGGDDGENGSEGWARA